ncbi:potassium-transporting ATPase subunit KdpC [Klugiella xanthotipulae]|uniref:Potassium-transporting ATPase KdpC subunit n=1 Tax=Klugiella xanthotipulae TaxID=244735 RepID=A0A543HY76_9MICO|nr:potassium-transporting ATPase subunit KdpC [Klugiella xanthotipulae]TQM63307.1 K+-transporting ATPase ATPase C chain [Klugiella xanthotipulae]
MSAQRINLRHYGVALRFLLIATVVLGIGYPLVVTAIAQVALPAQANGSLVSAGGETVGSALIGQSFTDANGNALPEWFQSRPSAANYDATASGGSNRGPENLDLISAIRARQALIVAGDNVTTSEIPADAVTASASGLDPHISAEYARLQVPRVAAARGLPEAQVSELVESILQSRDLGFLGEPTVNVLDLNIALAETGT